MPQTIDICLAANPNTLGAHILLTVTDADKAQAIVEAVNDAEIFQGENLRAFTRAVDRTGPSVVGVAATDVVTDEPSAPVAAEGAEG